MASVAVAGLLGEGDELKKRRIGLDSALDLWLLGPFKLRIFRLSHRASQSGVCSLVLSLTVGNSGLKEIA